MGLITFVNSDLNHLKLVIEYLKSLLSCLKSHKSFLIINVLFIDSQRKLLKSNRSTSLLQELNKKSDIIMLENNEVGSQNRKSKIRNFPAQTQKHKQQIREGKRHLHRLPKIITHRNRSPGTTPLRYSAAQRTCHVLYNKHSLPASTL